MAFRVFSHYLRICKECDEPYFTKYRRGKKRCPYCIKQRGLKKGSKIDIDRAILSIIKRIDGK